MNSGFNYEQYTNYVNQMVDLMDNLHDSDIYTKLYNQTLPIMNLFGIAYLTNDYKEINNHRGLIPSEFGLPPEMKLAEPNLDCEVVVEKQISDAVYVKLIAYSQLGAPEWDDETKGLIKSFLNLYFNLIARVRILHMFETRIFQDPAFPFVGNLAAFRRTMEELRSQGELKNFTAYRINIYKFARYNRMLGRENGNEVLKRYSLKLKAFAGEKGGVYRLGGDNFVGLIPSEMIPAVHKFFEGYSMKISEELPEITVESRAGFFQLNSNDVTFDTVMNRITATLAKTTPKKKIKYFDLNEEKLEEMASQIENDFQAALENGEIVAFYQPKVEIETSKIVGVEALCRWIKPNMVIPPAAFIPVLERNNQICNLDFYMLDKVCEDLRNWMTAGHEVVRVSVNFSRNNLADKNFVEKVIAIIDKYQIPHHFITVELTETSLEVDFEDIVSVAKKLKGYNVYVAVDDFGMGYSSLKLIKDIGWNVLKVDKSFVPDKKNPNYEKNLVMLTSIITMANDTGMLSVMEGVETKEQVDLVKECGCKVIQGYYYDKPLCREEFESKLLGTYEGEYNWKA